ncbi:E3 ubiquitin-protein ligase complex slx8-rfp subunit slx8 isoform X2 [Cajanus cajan]|nr:E3 ubiquitin-protein ligase complex slx8-rfp subunit slx8 isoform X2 [Cajanus cajan]
MSSRTARSTRRRKMNLELDLNRDPPAENVREEEEGPSTQHQQQQLPMIDVEAIDDDVVESSPRSFAQAKSNNARRRVRRRMVVDVDLEEETRGDPQNQTIINGALYINLESSSCSVCENARKSPECPKEPPKEPVFNCPICMAPLVEEMSTRCGHIFCKNCIKAAVAVQGKCPTCRKKVTKNQLIRVFLPATS